MNVTVSTLWAPQMREGDDAIHLAIALDAVGADVTVRNPPVMPGLPDAFLDLLDAAPRPPDVLLHLGDASEPPPEADCPRAVWHHPANPIDAAEIGWDAVYATRANLFDRQSGVVPLGVDVDGFTVRRRTPPLTRLLLTGDDAEDVGACFREQHATLNDVQVSVADVATLSRTMRTRLYAAADVAYFGNVDAWQHAAEFAATGGYLVAVDDADMSGLLGRDWAWPLPPGSAMDETADALAAVLTDPAGPAKGHQAASYVRAAYDWDHAAVAVLRHLRRLL